LAPEWQDWADPILKKPSAVNDSHVEIPCLPSVGIEWNEDAVERYSCAL
jgi:L-alanine-DL-glutamate epimerase-like enolase superfamily enzyme